MSEHNVITVVKGGNNSESSYRNLMGHRLKSKSTRCYLSRVIFKKYPPALMLSLAFHSLLGNRYILLKESVGRGPYKRSLGILF